MEQGSNMNLLTMKNIDQFNKLSSPKEHSEEKKNESETDKAS